MDKILKVAKRLKTFTLDDIVMFCEIDLTSARSFLQESRNIKACGDKFEYVETIKADVVKNNEFRNTLDSLMNKESHNSYINLSNENNLLQRYSYKGFHHSIFIREKSEITYMSKMEY